MTKIIKVSRVHVESLDAEVLNGIVRKIPEPYFYEVGQSENLLVVQGDVQCIENGIEPLSAEELYNATVAVENIVSEMDAGSTDEDDLYVKPYLQAEDSDLYDATLGYVERTSGEVSFQIRDFEGYVFEVPTI